MIKTHPSPNVIWANVGNGDVDHTFWGRPEEWPSNLTRPSVMINTTHPGSDLAAEYAAAFAVGSMVFKDQDPIYSATLLTHATESYTFATTYLGKYNDSIGDTYYGLVLKINDHENRDLFIYKVFCTDHGIMKMSYYGLQHGCIVPQ
jgi:hypothetical protein